MSKSVIEEKSKIFASKIIKTYKMLSSEHNEYILSKQLLRSGTSIGANVKEGEKAQSKPDFYSKMSIALKEASETEYWLELLYENEYMNDVLFKELHSECNELIKILVAITKNSKK